MMIFVVLLENKLLQFYGELVPFKYYIYRIIYLHKEKN